MAFLSIQSRLLISILLVVAIMLGMQLGLNTLKFNSLLDSAAAERLQVTAGAMEAVIQRAEQSGLAIDEMRDLQAFLDRARSQDDIILGITIISPIGKDMVKTQGRELPLDIRPALLRKALGSGEDTSLLKIGPALFASRTLRDSNDEPMGAIILEAKRGVFAERSEAILAQLRNQFILIFGFVSLLLIPAVVWAVGGVVRAMDNLAHLKIDPDSENNIDKAEQGEFEILVTKGNQILKSVTEEVEMLIASSNEPTSEKKKGEA